MSNLSFTDKDLMEMERYASPAADREPYHLIFTRIHRGNAILNPHLPGIRNMAAGQEKGKGIENMENMISTEPGGCLYTTGEMQRIRKLREAAGHILSENMIGEMADLGFFLCPASLSHHGNYLGGLFDHSMQVFHNLEDLTNRLDLTWQRRESPLLIAVFHDWVKMQNYIQTGIGEEIHYIKDSRQLFPGHGEVSIMMAQQFLSRHKRIKQLTYEELACIRYHMGAFAGREEWDYYTDAIKRFPNVLWTHTADMLASQINNK